MEKQSSLLPVLVVEAALLSFLPTALDAYQRRWVQERDESCQFPTRHKCNFRHANSIHHIEPQHIVYARGECPDYPENVIRVCQNAHDIIHAPNYQRFKTWDKTWDFKLRRIAAERTRRAIKYIGEFPY